MSQQDFIAKYSGQFIDFDKMYGAQCVDLINQYCQEVLGIQDPIGELPGATAYEIYQNYAGQLFEKIANTPTGVPETGDIMFWDTSIGSAGHTDIFVNGDQNSFNGFDQNWPVGSSCHLQSHSYGGVVGWLHPKNPPETTPNLQDQLNLAISDRDTNWNCFLAIATALGITPDSNNKKGSTTDCINAIEVLKNKPPQTVTVDVPVDPVQGTAVSSQGSSVIVNPPTKNTKQFSLLSWLKNLLMG